jgi:protein-S-isoprenylcysteine O-methyltransferase Ste14
VVSSWWVALRAVLWSVLFAGTVGGYVPWRFFGVTPGSIRPATPTGVAGLVLFAAGAAVLACIGEFVTRGRGTPAPMDPPRALVVHGPYRVVRNPMYTGMVLALLGELGLAPSWGLAAYIVAWWSMIHLLVVLYEEPTLRQKFGAAYERYTHEVGRWWPKRVPRE